MEKGYLHELTDQDEGQADAEGQYVTTQRFVVFPITLCKHTQSRVNVVFTESLEGHHTATHHPSIHQSSISHPIHVFICI